ncbi:HTH domain-containing protein [Burkholderia stagnalis]|uniref:HTH domain-containing protein n=1 Tax=Burkholderia stagnalis TaxID=1503054 RepID=UPI0007569628|nr:HTH domain-containing protein [Burkholderia stagnalis]KVL93727.1 hypothetical protein WT03_14855 [Burkholderia stagnalis]
MAEPKMGLTSRRLLECLKKMPKKTASAPVLARELGVSSRAVRDTAFKLEKTGHIERGARGKDGFAIKFTGKQFPASADATPSQRWLRTKERRAHRREAERGALAVVIHAMRAMVDVGRAAA